MSSRFYVMSLLASGLALSACGGGDGASGDTKGLDPEAMGGDTMNTDDQDTGGTGGVVSATGGSSSGGSASGGSPGKDQPPDLIWPVDTGPIEAIDLLFVVDNSVSMGDKQALLKKAVPQMVERITNPPCVDENGLNPEPNTGTCPSGKNPAFPAVDDIHLGVISSSLGGHGSEACPDGGLADGIPQDYNDKGHLIPSVRTGLSPAANPGNKNFLVWNGGDATQQSQLVAAFEEQIAAVQDKGCGFEAQLESWYRFLIDPMPPASIVVGPSNKADIAKDDQGNPLIDETVLAQRKAFLRPNGFVAIVLVTDENDCSAMDGGSYYNNAGFGYLTAKTNSFHMPVSTAICEENSNDKCCISCLQSKYPPAGCEAQVAEACGETAPVLSPEEDATNVRCFDQTRRFGVDLLYPVERYVDALTKQQIINARNGETVDNPLLLGTGDVRPEKGRDPGRVVFMGLVGVPWQDIASSQSLSDPSTLRYLSAAEMRAKNVEADGKMVDRWAVILGEPNLRSVSKTCAEGDDPRCGAKPEAPLDPFMVSSILPRETGAENPITGDKIVAYTSQDPYANKINGHEADNAAYDSSFAGVYSDLQYSCIFELETPVSKAACASSASCECQGEPSRNRSVCQPPTGGPATTAQYFGKAYPSPRVLQVIRDIGDGGIVGSICPKIAKGDASQQAYGYNPALDALVRELGLRVDDSLSQ